MGVMCPPLQRWMLSSSQAIAPFYWSYKRKCRRLRSPYDEITHGTDFPGYSQVIGQNADDVSAIATQRRTSGDQTVIVADFYSPLTNALEVAKKQFPQLAPLIIPDRIHPAEIAHWMMAAELLSAWHLDPVVSRVSIK